MIHRQFGESSGLGAGSHVKRSPVLLASVLMTWSLGVPALYADHALEFYPSYYPHEIRIDTVDPGSAAALLSKHAIHAYVGEAAFGAEAAPAEMRTVESLGSYLVVTFNTASPAWRDRATRCARGGELVAALASGKADSAFVVHPYPVTPFHADYLQQFDLADSARKAVASRERTISQRPAMKLLVKGKVAGAMVPSEWRTSGSEWDATVEDIGVEELVAPIRISLNGWLGPPWIKEGWFQAYRLLEQRVTDQEVRRSAESLYRDLVTGVPDGAVARYNAERKLVSLLLGGCERIVVGYTVRREYYNSSDYADGVENIAADSQDGFVAPIFIRTVKLKDFLWNGWLRLGVEGQPQAAWNPLGGFNDAAGRLIWAAVGDPAEFLAPGSATWVPNRVTYTVSRAESPGGAITVPEDALLPEPGTGTLRPVGAGRIAKTKIVYRILTSAFHDQTRMSLADILYPYVFAYRWGVPHTADGAEYDPSIAASTALLREWLAGVRPLKEEREVKKTQEGTFTFPIQVVEVYLTRGLTDPQQAAAVAPPWSSLPWHVTALMEEMVKRGYAAFSAEEAQRRGLPWLDLVRDRSLGNRLVALVGELRSRGYAPASLGRFVTGNQARGRWMALEKFYAAHRHFLVTDGPYRLREWSGRSVVLEAFRDPTYPLGISQFDRYPIPRRAFASQVEVQGDRLTIRVEVESLFKYQRSYRITRMPLRGPASEVDPQDIPVCRYLVVGRDGAILFSGTSPYEDAGLYRIDLAGRPRSGPTTVLLGIYLGGNTVNPELRMVRVQG